MTVKCITENKIKVILNMEERYRLFGEAEYLSPENPAIKSALKVILKRVRYECPFLEEGSSVYIDIYKDSFGGFIIYFTKINNKNLSQNTFVFSNADNLLDAISSIKREVLDYKIFAKGERFYLKIGNSAPSNLIPHIREFCDR